MASRYRKKFSLPDDFMEILECYSREVLRDQPIDIIEFSYLYFKALEEVSQPGIRPHASLPKHFSLTEKLIPLFFTLGNHWSIWLSKEG